MPGYFKSEGSKELVAIDPPVGVLPGYVRREPSVLYMRSKIFSLKDTEFPITDGNGDVVVRVTAPSLSFKFRRDILDDAGNVLFKLHCPPLRLLAKVIAMDADDREVFVVENRFTVKTKMTVTFTNYNSKQKETLHLEGDMLGRSADIRLADGRVVAQLDRQLFKKGEITSNKESYFVWIAPGVDLALLASLCVAFSVIKEQYGQ
ncbi:hypothetical protein Q8F55_001528 [Vanrija albida]|uniref:Tubby C-terminal domain-containing protein n=1 Tax=Vanrija albida TaxID=181172 RepID=A0ABR3QH95_9TREE